MKRGNLQENGDQLSVTASLTLRKTDLNSERQKLHVNLLYVDLRNVLHPCIKTGKTKQKAGKKTKR